jgi:hypothetical protein
MSCTELYSGKVRPKERAKEMEIHVIPAISVIRGICGIHEIHEIHEIGIHAGS